MQIIPVLDVLHGQVVRGVAGQRENYRPIVSTLTVSHDPIDVAQALRDRFALRTFYVADLDGIVHSRPSLTLARDLAALGCSAWIDNGAKTIDEVEQTLATGAGSIVGLESWPDLESLRKVALSSPSDVLFSLDLRGGRPVHGAGWPVAESLEIAEKVVAAGVGRLIVLDVASVGTGTGIPTLPLCRMIRERWPRVELVTGGGVRSVGDLEEAEQAGVDALLVASVLHDGRLSPADVSRFR